MGCVTVTQDDGFEKLHERLLGLRSRHPVSHAGVIIIKSGSSPSVIANHLARLVEKTEGFADFLENYVMDL